MTRRSRERGRSGSGRRHRPASTELFDVTIERIGHRGDGMANGPRGRVYVPLTVPGDRVRVRETEPLGDGHAVEVIEILADGPDRTAPPCPHFNLCGGCSLQHLTDSAYEHWKRDQLLRPLARAGFNDCEMAEMVRTPPASRRRATFTAMRGSGTNDPVLLGFNVRRGHDLVDLQCCLVIEPQIAALLPKLRFVLSRMMSPRQRTQVSVALLEGGLDVVLHWPETPDLAMRQRLASFATEASIARLSLQTTTGSLPEPIVQQRPVGAIFAGTFVAVPPGAFLQASQQGEAALVEAASSDLASSRTVADLFAGVGTFTFALAKAGARVHAVDGNSDALNALATAARTQPRVTWQERDLFINPLQAVELKRFDAVVFDPPRAGARAQAEQLARSTVPLVIAVSCNPNSFVRDARILVGGGYRLQRIIPVDQFLWSAHLELVALFRR